MNGFQLKFFTYENRKHQDILLYEWLIEKAKELGINGGSVFRAIAGYGRHGIIHEEHFFELSSNTTVEVVFILPEMECAQLLSVIKEEKINIFYVKTAAEFGTLF